MEREKATRTASKCHVEECLGYRICMLTISLLSMPTFRRLPATELMSRSFSQDLKSFTAKAAETPRADITAEGSEKRLSSPPSRQSQVFRRTITEIQTADEGEGLRQARNADPERVPI